ncbi:hypothetical protein [Halalkalicoccus subterraneus]|uniref:hypothetical protein n=1 Tax=Halalkalicoccus subterraneus TaxID=2675002 RepID=UPI000EFD8649|nr:hypothetical protein [Halalkalicoccus subterraneus]
MGFLSSTNAGAAKVIGLGTIGLAIFLIGQWGILAALFLATAGGVLFMGTGDELPRFSIRNFGLFVFYWLFLLLGIGVGID